MKGFLKNKAALVAVAGEILSIAIVFIAKYSLSHGIDFTYKINPNNFLMVAYYSIYLFFISLGILIYSQAKQRSLFSFLFSTALTIMGIFYLFSTYSGLKMQYYMMLQ